MSDQKVAVITAGGSGMGADAARRLAEDGYNVAILSSSGKGEALAKDLGGTGVTGSNQSNGDLKRLTLGLLGPQQLHIVGESPPRAQRTTALPGLPASWGRDRVLGIEAHGRRRSVAGRWPSAVSMEARRKVSMA